MNKGSKMEKSEPRKDLLALGQNSVRVTFFAWTLLFADHALVSIRPISPDKDWAYMYRL